MDTTNPINLIHFEKVNHAHQEVIFQWLTEPHMQEFWDNSQEHKDDIINFINGRVEPSNYFDGIFTYWIGLIDHTPFCFVLTSLVNNDAELPQIWQDNISTTGTTYSIDFCIGNPSYLGQKLAAPSLKLFTEFFQDTIDPSVDTFFIDPAEHNPRAKHVYEQAGFKMAGDFEMNVGVFNGETTHLMLKKVTRNQT